MDRRWLLATLAACLFGPRVFAQVPAAPKYVVLSLIGDELTYVSKNGDQVSPDFRDSQAIRKSAKSDEWDMTALQVISRVLPKSVPGASLSFLKGSLPEYFADQADWFDGDSLKLPERLKLAVYAEHAQFLVLLTKSPASTTFSDEHRVVGRDKLSGLGFYARPAQKTTGTDEEPPFIMPYVHAKLSLVDLSTRHVVREAMIHRFVLQGYFGVSTGVLQDLLIEGLQDATQQVLAPSSAAVAVELRAHPAAATTTAPAATPSATANDFPRAPHIFDRRWCEFPDYPPTAVRAGASGRTVLQLDVDASGHLSAVQVSQSAGSSREHALLDQVAAQAVAACSFDAARDATGHPVAGSMVASYEWTLTPSHDNPGIGIASATLHAGALLESDSQQRR